MADERVSSGLMRAVLSSVGSSLEDRRRLCDVALMVALADTFVTDDDVGRIVATIQTYAEFESLDSEWMEKRIAELRETAPLFSEQRAALLRDVTDPRLVRFALALSSRLVGSIRKIQDDEKAVLQSLADAFQIPESERASLFAPWTPAPRFADSSNYQRCAFNAPENKSKRTIFDAMSEAATDEEFRFLVHKVAATRYLLNKLFEDAEILGLGELIPVGPYAFHADAIIEHTANEGQTVLYQRFLTRFLAHGEELHPMEHSVLSALWHHLDESTQVLVAHTGDLSTSDRVFIQGSPPHTIREEHLEF